MGITPPVKIHLIIPSPPKNNRISFYELRSGSIPRQKTLFLALIPRLKTIKLLKECEYYEKRLDFSKKKYKIRAYVSTRKF